MWNTKCKMHLSKTHNALQLMPKQQSKGSLRLSLGVQSTYIRLRYRTMLLKMKDKQVKTIKCQS